MVTVIHAIVGYFYLLLTVRVLRRRPGAQLSPFEFVIIFLIGGVIILTTLGNDRWETNSVCAIITVGLMHRIVSSLAQRSEKVAAVVYGTPLVVLKDGEWQMETLETMGLQMTDIMATARSKGVKTIDEVKYAILERNGSISIMKR